MSTTNHLILFRFSPLPSSLFLRPQDDEVGDGTTSVAVFCGELLREAEKLISQRIHPQTICKGWRLARDAARKALEKHARDNADNEEKVREGRGVIKEDEEREGEHID